MRVAVPGVFAAGVLTGTTPAHDEATEDSQRFLLTLKRAKK
jgi:hypothetical protein